MSYEIREDKFIVNLFGKRIELDPVIKEESGLLVYRDPKKRSRVKKEYKITLNVYYTLVRFVEELKKAGLDPLKIDKPLLKDLVEKSLECYPAKAYDIANVIYILGDLL